jgi:hypothetical protein
MTALRGDEGVGRVKKGSVEVGGGCSSVCVWQGKQGGCMWTGELVGGSCQLRERASCVQARRLLRRGR